MRDGASPIAHLPHHLAFVHKEISLCLLVPGVDDSKGGMMQLPELRVHQTSASQQNFCAPIQYGSPRHDCRLLLSHHTPLNPTTLLISMSFPPDNVLLVELKR